MINTKATLKKLHSKFPILSLDDLFEILDCYVEENCLWTRDITWSSEPKPETLINTSPYTTNITCNEDLNSNKIMATRTCSTGELKAN
jgi:hypothetical protein